MEDMSHCFQITHCILSRVREKNEPAVDNKLVVSIRKLHTWQVKTFETARGKKDPFAPITINLKRNSQLRQ